MNIQEQYIALAVGHSDAVSLVPTTKRVVGSNPAANTEASLEVPEGVLWRLLGVSLTSVQGATQTPLPHLLVTDEDDAVVARVPGASSAQAVSTTCQFTWAPGVALTAPVGATTEVAACAPLPSGLILLPGATLATLTAGKGANTDLSALSAYVVEYA